MGISLTGAQRAEFESVGHLRLREASAPEAAIRLQERMWAELADDFGIDRGDPGTWRQPMQSLRRAKRDPLQGAVATDRLLGAIGALLGPIGWRPPSNWGVVLVTFPDRRPGEWTLPTTGWHFDFELDRNSTSLGGLFVFTFYSTVEARGGGTLIVEGSHRLLRRFHAELSPDERRAPHRELRRRLLRFDPWLRDLTGAGPTPPGNRIETFMREAREVRGIPLRVAELTGQPGDAILCHPLMLHAASQNRAETPRFMRSQRICEEHADALLVRPEAATR
jgi:hypothetical protein